MYWKNISRIQLFTHLITFIIVLLISTPIFADWISLTGAETAPNIAEITVHDNYVELKLEIYINDIKHYEELIPDDWMTEQKDRPSLEKRMVTFAKNKFSFVTDSGEYLPAQLKLVEPRSRTDRFSPFAGMINPITRQRVPEAPADKRVLYAEIIYPFSHKSDTKNTSIQKPETLTIIPPIDDKGLQLTTIGFVIYHKSVPVIDFRYLSKATLNLNWDDPWYSKFKNANLKRHHKDAMMSYLYIENYEVRHEVLTRVKDMSDWMALELRNPDYIETDELEPLKQRIAQFLATKNSVTIDGKKLAPIIDRTSYVKVSLQGIKLIEQPQRLDTNTAIIGVILTYLVDAIPQKVSVDWELFSERIQQVPSTATDPAGPLSTFVTPDFPQHKWTNYLKNYQAPQIVTIAVDKSLSQMSVPIISIALLMLTILIFWILIKRQRLGSKVKYHWLALFVLGPALVIARPYGNIAINRPVTMIQDLTPVQATTLMQNLLKNVYRAFDFRNEEAIYDKLADSVEGDLLADIYLQNRQSFSVQQAGGAQAKVKEVSINDVILSRNPGNELSYTMNTKWNAKGSVGHWGHTHIRQNYYDANIKIVAIDGKWKITQLDLIEEKRIDPVNNTPENRALSKQIK